MKQLAIISLSPDAPDPFSKRNFIEPEREKKGRGGGGKISAVPKHLIGRLIFPGRQKAPYVAPNQPWIPPRVLLFAKVAE